MDLVKTLYLDRHRAAHAALDSVLKPLNEAQIRTRPHTAVNSIAWLTWHVARAEDIALNRLVTDGVQVFDEKEWGEQLKVPIRHFGVGMTFAEVDALSNRIDLPAVRAYLDAVGERTRHVVDALDTATLTEVVSAEHIHKLLYDEGVGGGEGAYVEGVWHERTRGTYLMYLGMSHFFIHCGEAQTICSLMATR